MKQNIAQLMQQAQKMQENLRRAQEQLGDLEATGTAGAGMVKVTLTGRFDVRKVEIDDSIMDDRDMLEDMVAAAFNDAVNRVQAATKEKMSELTGGINLPPGLF